MKAAVSALERVAYASHSVNYLKPCKQVNINFSGVANEAHNGLHLTL